MWKDILLGAVYILAGLTFIVLKPFYRSDLAKAETQESMRKMDAIIERLKK